MGHTTPRILEVLHPKKFRLFLNQFCKDLQLSSISKRMVGLLPPSKSDPPLYFIGRPNIQCCKQQWLLQRSLTRTGVFEVTTQWKKGLELNGAEAACVLHTKSSDLITVNSDPAGKCPCLKPAWPLPVSVSLIELNRQLTWLPKDQPATDFKSNLDTSPIWCYIPIVCNR